MLPEGVAVHITRLRLVGGTSDELLAMTDKVEEAAELVSHAGADLIAFHCTAVSTFNSEMEVSLKRRITAATSKPAVTTSEALVAAFRALNARRIVLLSPYTKEVNDREIAFFEHHGITVLHEIGLTLNGGAAYSEVEPSSWYKLAMVNRHPDADAYFLSCTTIRATPIISILERDMAKPVVTSNQAMVWHALRVGGLRDFVEGFGTLFSH